MAADFCPITKTNRPLLGTSLIRLANTLLDARDLCKALNSTAQHCFNGGDFSVFEGQFGLANPGDGGSIVTLLSLVNTILNTNGAVTDQDRVDKLDEFVSRLAGQ